MNRVAPCLTPASPRSLLCHHSQSRITETHAAAASSNYSALSLACSSGVGMGVALKDNARSRPSTSHRKHGGPGPQSGPKSFTRKGFFGGLFFFFFEALSVQHTCRNWCLQIPAPSRSWAQIASLNIQETFLIFVLYNFSISCQSPHFPCYSKAASHIQATPSIVVTESSCGEMSRIQGKALSTHAHGCLAVSWWMRGSWSCWCPSTQTLLLLRLGLSAEQGDTWNSLTWWQNSSFTTQAEQKEGYLYA